jgi:hypothetical protein
VLKYYGGSHIRALTKLYPELNLDKGKFLEHKGYLQCSFMKIKFGFIGLERIEKRRQFFEKLAKSRNFNPLDAEKWYSFTKSDFDEAEVCNVLNWIPLKVGIG